MTVKAFRLVTGEDIISKVKETLQPNNDSVTLDNPAQIILQRNGDNVGVALAPYMPLIAGDVIIHNTAIVSQGIPDTQLENEYNAKFGSGIVIAPANAVPNIQK